MPRIEDGAVEFTSTVDIDSTLNVDGNSTLMGTLAVGIATAQGRLHGHDGTGGFLFVTKTGITGTAVTLIPDGTGDVVKACQVYGICSNGSNGAMVNGNLTGLLTPGGSDITVTPDAGTNIYNVRCNANGSVDVRRTTGTTAGIVALWLIWL